MEFAMPTRAAHTHTHTRPHSAPARSKKQDAIALLKADHKTVSGLFKQYEKAEDDRARKIELATEICTELTIHATIEEEIFYPQARKAFGDDEDGICLLDEAEVEHGSLKVLIAQIEEALDGAGPDEKTDAKVTVLKEYVEHHVKEEEKELFPKLRKTDMDLAEAGEELRARKEELKAEGTNGRMQHLS
jgi:hemerythrin-like domain-containing protein